MNSIELMVNEHKNIKRMLAVIRKYCFKVLKNQQLDYNDFYRIIDFVRNYADKHHHGKEEKILFRIMMENMGPVADKLIRNGMLVEHDLGRLHLTQLEAAIEDYEKNPVTDHKLDIISNAVGYGALLQRHIEKEDQAAYAFAARALPADKMNDVDTETENFEIQARKDGVQDHYENWLRGKLAE